MELSGIWGRDNLPFLELTFDALENVSGTTYWRSGGRSVRAPIQKGSFDPNTRALKLEGDAPSLDGDGESRYVIEGSFDKEVLIGTYDCGGLKGDFTFTKLAARNG